MSDKATKVKPVSFSKRISRKYGIRDDTLFKAYKILKKTRVMQLVTFTSAAFFTFAMFQLITHKRSLNKHWAQKEASVSALRSMSLHITPESTQQIESEMKTDSTQRQRQQQLPYNGIPTAEMRDIVRILNYIDKSFIPYFKKSYPRRIKGESQITDCFFTAVLGAALSMLNSALHNYAILEASSMRIRAQLTMFSVWNLFLILAAFLGGTEFDNFKDTLRHTSLCYDGIIFKIEAILRSIAVSKGINLKHKNLSLEFYDTRSLLFIELQSGWDDEKRTLVRLLKYTAAVRREFDDRVKSKLPIDKESISNESKSDIDASTENSGDSIDSLTENTKDTLVPSSKDTQKQRRSVTSLKKVSHNSPPSASFKEASSIAIFAIPIVAIRGVRFSQQKQWNATMTRFVKHMCRRLRL